MTWRHVRNILLVVGTYSIATWLATFITLSGVAGTEFRGFGRLGELWMDSGLAVPRVLAAAAGTVVLWFVMGAARSRRWVWAFAGLFAAFGLVNRRFGQVRGVPVDQVSRVMDVAVWCLLPTVGCLAAWWLLARYARTTSTESEATTGGGRRALVVVWSLLMALGGGFAGMWVSQSLEVARMGGWTAAVLESGRRSEYAYTQYRDADYESAKVALTEFAGYLAALKPSSREWQPGQAPFSDGKALAFDKMVTYGRLALVAERAKHPEEASGYWQRAEQEAQILRWQEPTRDRIRDAVIRLDAGKEANRNGRH